MMRLALQPGRNWACPQFHSADLCLPNGMGEGGSECQLASGLLSGKNGGNSEGQPALGLLGSMYGGSGGRQPAPGLLTQNPAPQGSKNQLR